MLHVHTIEAYLPVHTDIISKESHSEESEELISESIKVSRTLFLKNLYFRIDDVLQSLADAALVGVRAQTSDQ